MSSPDYLVLLGGMMCDERLWAEQCSELRDRVKKIVIGDLSRSATIEEMAHYVLRSAPDRFALAGLSMGGNVALEMWRQAPRRIRRLALLNTNPAPEAPDRKARRREQILNARRGMFQAMMGEELSRSYLGSRSHPNPALFATALDMTLDLGVDVFERQSMALAGRRDLRRALDTITCPSIVVCGREDVRSPPSDQQLVADGIPHSKLIVLDECGHLPPLEKPRTVSRLLDRLMHGES